MPITHGPGGTTFEGDSIRYFQVATQLSAVKLEANGVRMRRRGPALWKVYRDHYAIPGIGNRKATEQAVIAWLTAKVEELRAQQVHITEGEPPSNAEV